MNCIYQLIFENNSYYIGVTNNLKRRLSEHKCAFRKRIDLKIIHCVVLFDNLTIDESYILERTILDRDTLSDPLCLNQTIGGRHPIRKKGYKHTQASKDHLSKVKSGKKAFTTPEITQARISAYKKTCEERYGVSNIFKSEDFKKRRREYYKTHPYVRVGKPGTMLGKKFNSEQLSKISYTISTPKGIFDSSVRAAQYFNITQQTVINRCKSKKLPDWQIINIGQKYQLKE